MNKDAYRALLFDTSESIFKPHTVGRDWWRLQFYFSPVPSCQHLYLKCRARLKYLFNISPPPPPLLFDSTESGGILFSERRRVCEQEKNIRQSHFSAAFFYKKSSFQHHALKAAARHNILRFFVLKNDFSHILPASYPLTAIKSHDIP